LPLSAVDCVQPALQHARDQLFRPFRFGQWSRLALVGFLAAELHTGGCSVPNFGGFNFPVPQNHPRGDEFLASAFPKIDPVRLAQMAGLIGVILLLGCGLFLVFLYLNSVFRFILLDSVIKKRCSIREGWGRWHRAGWRYFLWQLVLMTVEAIVVVFLIGVPLLIAGALGWFHDLQQHLGRTILGAFLLVGLFLLFALCAAAVQLLAKDFLVPIMAFDDVDFADGWSRLMSMIRPEKGKFVVYLLLKIVLMISAAILFGIVTLIPIIVLVVPAVIAVFAGYKAGLSWNVATISLVIIMGSALFALLMYLVALISVPAAVFFPAFSLYFFAPRYPKLDALLNPPPPVPEAPPVIETPPSPSPPPEEPPPLPPAPEPIG
jgi:hypothetical protein